MTKQERILLELAGQAKEEESTLWIGRVETQESGEYQVSVNARATTRQAVCSNGFAFASQVPGSDIRGEYVLVVASEYDDMAFIVGSSPYAI